MNVSANMLRSNFYVCPICGNMIHSMGQAFVCCVSSDRMQMVKLYPEGNAQARLKIHGVKEIFCYCNRDGLF